VALTAQIPVVEIAAATARALDELLGADRALTNGTVAVGDSIGELLARGDTRAVALPFGDGLTGEVILVVEERLATAMEEVTPDASFAMAALPALLAGVRAIALTMNVAVVPRNAVEIATQDALETGSAGDAAVPLFDNDALVACLVVRVVDDALSAAGAAIGPASATERVYTGFGGHEFQPPGGSGAAPASARPLALLHDVAVEVTAVLGRRRLMVRDIVTLQPGSVLPLDRSAGSPVDVLVNGALVWRGEVVVVDDDLCVRVADIVVDESSSMPRTR
jgi:flagellar motor switch protein FliN/FliY